MSRPRGQVHCIDCDGAGRGPQYQEGGTPTTGPCVACKGFGSRPVRLGDIYELLLEIKAALPPKEEPRDFREGGMP